MLQQEVKKFTEVFPGVEPGPELYGLIDEVIVEKVIYNRVRNLLKVFIVSEKWISKDKLHQLEQNLKYLLAEKSLDVIINERFSLSSQYTPENFFQVYRESIAYEFAKKDMFLKQMFLGSEYEFQGTHSLIITTQHNLISDEYEDEFVERLSEIFNHRAGFDLKIDLIYEDTQDRSASDEDIKAEVDLVLTARKQRMESKNEEKEKTKLSNDKAVKAARPRGTISETSNQVMGRPVTGEPVEMATLGEIPGEVIVRGEIFRVDKRELNSGKFIFTISITDYTDSIRAKFFVAPENMASYEKVFKVGACFIFKGMMSYDQYDREVMIGNVNSVARSAPILKKRMDNAPEKRIELHCHTKMSDMDAVSSATDIIRQAYEWGHKAIAITDHGVVQAFPEALHTFGGKCGIPKDADIKIIYGMEAYLVDDVKNIVFNAGNTKITDPVVIFSTVTTGSSPLASKIIEISAVRFENGIKTDEMYSFVDPEMPIPFAIEQVTGIDDGMVNGAPKTVEVLRKFHEFSKGAYLVAYNCEYEMSFINQLALNADLKFDNAYFDIVNAAKLYIKGLGKTKFSRFAKALHVEPQGSIRAQERALCMSQAYMNLMSILTKNGIECLSDLNEKGHSSKERILNLPYYHAIILAKNETGRRNLYRLVSESHLNYFKKRPRIPKSLLSEFREGLILGSACSAGELFQAILGENSDADIARIVDYYDYLEVQPVGNNDYLVREHINGIESYDDIREINKKIVKLGEVFKKPVVATCDVHFLNPGDSIYREIIQAGHGYTDTDQPPLYLHTTDEMLEEFSYLGENKAHEIVIDNPALINEMCEKISPIHPDKCPPEIPNSDTDLYNICYSKAREIYGENLPVQVSERLEKELNSIIKNGYAVMYIIAQRLVEKSVSDGYLVGSRGSVGSSFVATMASITEVNPLPPHYYCKKCHYSDFESEDVRKYAGRAGCDMPDKICPVCGEKLCKDGFDIPFETFLGFKGDKEPDIDLNFSGDEQTIAQNYTEVIFGKGQTFKAGTIGTVAEKTAIGFTKGYFEKKNQVKKMCEIERLSSGCTGIRRTTGQHPGGVIVLPKGMDINWFTPVQHPANDVNSDVITTHFDYHSIDKNLLKLDILGHDDPTMIKMLGDLTGTDPRNVSLDDPGVLSLFTSTEALGIKPDAIGGVPLGVLGIPEFGTNFVIGMLLDTKPSSFSELIRISGLSHGTDVWLNNAQELIREGKANLSGAICTRDDIMLYLIGKGMDPEESFKIMESVRKGKGLKGEMEEHMKEANVPDWYIWSCKRIKYMFPKAHAAAYVMMAFRIAYYKINYPLAYYAAYFTIRASGFSFEKMCLGLDKLNYYINEYENKEKSSNTDDVTLRDMYIVREMYARGFEFKKMDIYAADASKFKIVDGGLMPSLSSIDGLGTTAAQQIQEAASKGKFLSLDDFRNRSKASKTIAEKLVSLGILTDIPESNQISIFDSALFA